MGKVQLRQSGQKIPRRSRDNTSLDDLFKSVGQADQPAFRPWPCIKRYPYRQSAGTPIGTVTLAYPATAAQTVIAIDPIDSPGGTRRWCDECL